MRFRTYSVVLAFALLLAQNIHGNTYQAQQAAPAALVLSDAVLARLPIDWRQPATLLKATDAEQQRLLRVNDEVLRQTVARLLARNPAADWFLKSQLGKDPSPLVRTTIVQVIAADARWMALPDTSALLEGVVALDPDAGVSLDRARNTATVADARVSTRCSPSGSRPQRSAATRRRWRGSPTNKSDGSLSNAGRCCRRFCATPPPLFNVKPADARGAGAGIRRLRQRIARAEGAGRRRSPPITATGRSIWR